MNKSTVIIAMVIVSTALLTSVVLAGNSAHAKWIIRHIGGISGGNGGNGGNGGDGGHGGNNNHGVGGNGGNGGSGG
jgi:hypothetical protein